MAGAYRHMEWLNHIWEIVLKDGWSRGHWANGHPLW